MNLARRDEHATAGKLAQERGERQGEAACEHRRHYYGKNAGVLCMLRDAGRKWRESRNAVRQSPLPQTDRVIE